MIDSVLRFRVADSASPFVLRPTEMGRSDQVRDMARSLLPESMRRARAYHNPRPYAAAVGA